MTNQNIIDRKDIKEGQGFPANMFARVATNSVMWQLMNLTAVLSHVHDT